MYGRMTPVTLNPAAGVVGRRGEALGVSAPRFSMRGSRRGHLRVGMEVSARYKTKYKGALCRATIVGIEDHKVYVVSVEDGPKQEQWELSADELGVDQEGELVVGTEIRVPHPSTKQLCQARIKRCCDNSLYTVRFDDGDTATLHRRALRMADMAGATAGEASGASSTVSSPQAASVLMEGARTAGKSQKLSPRKKRTEVDKLLEAAGMSLMLTATAARPRRGHDPGGSCTVYKSGRNTSSSEEDTVVKQEGVGIVPSEVAEETSAAGTSPEDNHVLSQGNPHSNIGGNGGGGASPDWMCKVQQEWISAGYEELQHCGISARDCGGSPLSQLGEKSKSGIDIRLAGGATGEDEEEGELSRTASLVGERCLRRLSEEGARPDSVDRRNATILARYPDIQQNQWAGKEYVEFLTMEDRKQDIEVALEAVNRMWTAHKVAVSFNGRRPRLDLTTVTRLQKQLQGYQESLQEQPAGSLSPLPAGPPVRVLVSESFRFRLSYRHRAASRGVWYGSADPTYDWRLWVESPDNQPIQQFLRKVEFHILPSSGEDQVMSAGPPFTINGVSSASPIQVKIYLFLASPEHSGMLGMTYHLDLPDIAREEINRTRTIHQLVETAEERLKQRLLAGGAKKTQDSTLMGDQAMEGRESTRVDQGHRFKLTQEGARGDRDHNVPRVLTGDLPGLRRLSKKTSSDEHLEGGGGAQSYKRRRVSSGCHRPALQAVFAHCEGITTNHQHHTSWTAISISIAGGGSRTMDRRVAPAELDRFVATKNGAHILSHLRLVRMADSTYTYTGVRGPAEGTYCKTEEEAVEELRALLRQGDARYVLITLSEDTAAIIYANLYKPYKLNSGEFFYAHASWRDVLRAAGNEDVGISLQDFCESSGLEVSLHPRCTPATVVSALQQATRRIAGVTKRTGGGIDQDFLARVSTTTPPQQRSRYRPEERHYLEYVDGGDQVTAYVELEDIQVVHLDEEGAGEMDGLGDVARTGTSSSVWYTRAWQTSVHESGEHLVLCPECSANGGANYGGASSERLPVRKLPSHWAVFHPNLALPTENICRGCWKRAPWDELQGHKTCIINRYFVFDGASPKHNPSHDRDRQVLVGPLPLGMCYGEVRMAFPKTRIKSLFVERREVCVRLGRAAFGYAVLEDSLSAMRLVQAGSIYPISKGVQHAVKVVHL